MSYNKLFLFAITGLFGVSAQIHAAKRPSLDQMWKIIQQQQKEIKKLKRKNRRLNDKLEVVANGTGQRDAAPVPGQRKSGQVNTGQVKKGSRKIAGTRPSVRGNGSATGKRTTIGGYGELHYNNLDSKKEVDFHRFVLFFSHRFNNRVSFHSEIEIEHALAGESKPGEVEIEQAYINYQLNDRHAFKGGIFLMPVGILNETHEPNTFYGVERNNVEKNIIPSTWWEAGVMFAGQIGNRGWSYDIGLHSGLKIDAASSYAIRSGRQKGAKANADDLAYTGRIKWTGMPGLTVSASVQYQENAGQSLDPNIGSALMFTTHAVYQKKRFGVRALYATWDVEGSGPASVGADKQEGWYVEPSFKINRRLGVFARYSEWDNAANSAVDTKYTQWDVGINYWLHENVVLKFDVQRQGGAGSDDGFNIGIGYQF